MIKELIKKYNLKKDSYFEEKEVPSFSYENEKISELQKKWKSHIPDGWYGFLGLGYNTPQVWFEAIDEFLEYVLVNNPNMEIYQVKVKFGGLRLYIGNVEEKFQKEAQELCDCFFDYKLIY